MDVDDQVEALLQQSGPGASLEGLRTLSAALQCGVCHDLLASPVVTPCQHTFCSNCIRRFLAYSHSKAAKKECPCCRQALDESQLLPVPALREVSQAFRSQLVPQLRQLLARHAQQLQEATAAASASATLSEQPPLGAAPPAGGKRRRADEQQQRLQLQRRAPGTPHEVMQLECELELDAARQPRSRSTSPAPVHLRGAAQPKTQQQQQQQQQQVPVPLPDPPPGMSVCPVCSTTWPLDRIHSHVEHCIMMRSVGARAGSDHVGGGGGGGVGAGAQQQPSKRGSGGDGGGAADPGDATHHHHHHHRHTPLAPSPPPNPSSTATPGHPNDSHAPQWQQHPQHPHHPQPLQQQQEPGPAPPAAPSPQPEQPPPSPPAPPDDPQVALDATALLQPVPMAPPPGPASSAHLLAPHAPAGDARAGPPLLSPQAPLQPLHPNAGAAAHFAHPGAVAPPPAAAAHAGGGARGLREQDVPPKVVFSIVKASDLKSLLERHGLPADGNREDMCQRYNEYRLYLQAKLDEGSGMDLGQLRASFLAQHVRQQARRRAGGGALSNLMAAQAMAGVALAGMPGGRGGGGGARAPGAGGVGSGRSSPEVVDLLDEDGMLPRGGGGGATAARGAGGGAGFGALIEQAKQRRMATARQGQA